MPQALRHAICNEVYETRPFAETCRSVRQAGYDGLEIAPFTLAESPTDVSAARRRELRAIMESENLAFVGLHWLMVSPKGLHVTTPDAALYQRSWDHIRHLIDLCADLGPDGVLVFGSPQQRRTTGGLTREEAMRRFVEGLRSVADQAGERGVTILIEALPAGQSDVILTLDEAAALAAEINHPAVQTMFDTHNAVDEVEPHETLVARHYDRIRHVHVNEMDGRHAGAGDYDFAPVLRTLRERDYRGWVSLEAFDFKPGADTIARESLAHLKAVEAALDGAPVAAAGVRQ